MKPKSDRKRQSYEADTSVASYSLKTYKLLMSVIIVIRSDDHLPSTSVPHLDLDFSTGEDISSQEVTMLKGATTETNSSLNSTEKLIKKEKRVHYNEEQLSAAARKPQRKPKSKKP